MGQLLTELGFLPINLTPDSIERELLFDIWNVLKGEENNGVTIGNILTMLFAIQGIDPAIISDQHRHNVDPNEEPAIGVFDEHGVFYFTVADINQIFVKFKPLYVNRVYHIG